MNLKKKESQNVAALVHIRRENKILTGGNTGTNRGAGTEEKVIHRLPHLRIHSICNHQTQALLMMPSSAYWQEPDMDSFYEVVPESYRLNRGCLQLTIRLNRETTIKKPEKGLKHWKHMRPNGKNNIINQANPSELPGTKTPTTEHTWWDLCLQLHM